MHLSPDFYALPSLTLLRLVHSYVKCPVLAEPFECVLMECPKP